MQIEHWINSGYDKRRRQEEAAHQLQIAIDAEEKVEASERCWKKAVAITAALAVAVGLYAGYTATAQDEPETVQVQTGDTLWSIASQFAGDDEDIRQVYWRILEDNGLAADGVLQPGQVLKVRK